MESNIYFCPTVMELEFTRRIFEKYANTNFVKIRPVGADGDRKTDRKDEDNIRFLKFAKAPENAFVFTQIIYRTRPVV